MRQFLDGLFILLITHEGHVLTVLEGSDDVMVTERLQDGELVSEMLLLLFVGGRDSFEDKSMSFRSVGIDG